MFSVTDLFLMWAVMASVQLAATISPGPAFVISVRNALVYSRRVGVYTALGLALGVGMHVVLVLVGLAVLISNSVFLFTAIKYIGAAYLIYIGMKALFSAPKTPVNGDILEDKGGSSERFLPCERMISARKALGIGFLTNALNPKAVIFFTAVFTQFIGPETPFFMLVVYGVTSMVIEFGWFAAVSIVLTNASVKRRFMRIMGKIERACGGLMVLLGVRLAL